MPRKRSGSRAATLAALLLFTAGAHAGPCPADATGDFQVDVEDLIVVITQWGTPGPGGDINGDLVVDILDLVEVLLGWGTCDVCGDTGELEDEECGTDTNGGCNSSPPVYTDAGCGQSWCGTAWADGGFRDTDWYLFFIDEADVIATLTSDFPCMMFLVELPNLDCAGLSVVGPVGYSDNGETATIEVPVSGGQYAVFVAPGMKDGGVFDGLPCSDGPYTYSVTIDCAVP
jgi:hypothetical protein